MTEIPGVPLAETIPDGHLEESHPGCVKVAVIDMPSGQKLTAISIYGIIACSVLNGVRYAVTTVHRMLSDLTLLDTRRANDALVVMGGDFNISPQIGWPDTEYHKMVIERINSFRLVDWLLETNGDYVQTHRPDNKIGKTPWQDDWIFASEPVAERLVCRASLMATRRHGRCPTTVWS